LPTNSSSLHAAIFVRNPPLLEFFYIMAEVKVLEMNASKGREPPPLFPRFEVEEVGDFPCLYVPEMTEDEEERLSLHRDLLKRYHASPFHIVLSSKKKRSGKIL
jgi:hypothetical protein